MFDGALGVIQFKRNWPSPIVGFFFTLLWLLLFCYWAILEWFFLFKIHTLLPSMYCVCVCARHAATQYLFGYYVFAIAASMPNKFLCDCQGNIFMCVCESACYFVSSHIFFPLSPFNIQCYRVWYEIFVSKHFVVGFKFKCTVHSA